MCWKDIEIGRKQEPFAKSQLLIDSVVATIATADPRRTRIAFASSAAGTTTVGCEGVTPGAEIGWSLATNLPPIVFRVEEYGKLVCGEWKAFADGFNGAIIVTMSSLPLEEP